MTTVNNRQQGFAAFQNTDGTLSANHSTDTNRWETISQEQIGTRNLHSNTSFDKRDAISSLFPDSDKLLAMLTVENPNAKNGAIPKDISEALIKQQKPFASDLQDLRQALGKADAFSKVKEKQTFDQYGTLEIGEGPGKIKLFQTQDRDIFVAQKGDKTFVLNNRQPLLDVMSGSGGYSGKERIDWSESPQLRKQFRHGIDSALLSLGNIHLRDRDKESRANGDSLLKSELGIIDAAFKTGAMSESAYADHLGFVGWRYIHSLGNVGAGLPLQEKSLVLLEKTKGNSAIETLSARDELIDSYLSNGKKANANKLLSNQIAALSDSEKSGQGLDTDVVQVRSSLIKNLTSTGRPDDAEQVRSRALNLVLSNPDKIKPYEAGISVQRNDLIDHYLRQNDQKQSKLLLDDAVAAQKLMQKEEPDSPILELNQDELISRLKKANMKDKLGEVLDTKSERLDADAKLPNVDNERLERKQTKLAQDYLAADQPDKAELTAEKAIATFESRTSKTGDPAQVIQERLNLMSSLDGVSGRPPLKKFRNETMDQLNAFEKSDAGQKVPPVVADLRRSMIDQFVQAGDNKGAEPLLEKELAYLRANDSESFRLPKLIETYAGVEIKLGKFDKAIDLLEQHISQTPDDRNKLDALDLLSTAYEKLPDKAKAEKAKADAEAIRKGLPPQHYRFVPPINVR